MSNWLGEMTDEQRKLCELVNGSPQTQSMLYDLNLLPEQTLDDPMRWAYTATAVRHMELAADLEREACAMAVWLLRQQFTLDPDDDGVIQWLQDAEAAIRQRANIAAAPAGPQVTAQEFVERGAQLMKAGVSLAAALQSMRADVISCRSTVKSDLNHYERLAMVHGKTALAASYEAEAARLSALLDRIDALMVESGPAGPEEIAS